MITSRCSGNETRHERAAEIEPKKRCALLFFETLPLYHKANVEA